MNFIRYLTEQEIIAVNMYLIENYSPGETAGVKEPPLLNSAVHRPKQSAFGQDAYPAIPEKAAALFESLAQNHPFHNANKRTAFTSMILFIKYNKKRFVMDKKKAEDFTVDVVNHRYSFNEIITIIRDHLS